MATKGRQPNVNLVTLAQNQGGFSVNEHSGEVNPPGAFVAYEDAQQVVTGPLRSTDVAQFRSRYSDRLQDPENYLGGYREPAGIRQKSPQRPDDETYLDISRRFVDEEGAAPRLDRAMEFARGQAQISIYDTDAGLRYVHESPDVPEDQKYQYSAHLADAARAQKRARQLDPSEARTEQVEAMVDSIFAAQNLKR